MILMSPLGGRGGATMFSLQSIGGSKKLLVDNHLMYILRNAKSTSLYKTLSRIKTQYKNS